MQFQIDVKIEAGTRTETKVFAEPRSINQKEIKFKSGLVLTNYEIAKLIEDFLIDKLGVKNNDGNMSVLLKASRIS